MEVNKVTIPLEEYNSLRDFYREVKSERNPLVMGKEPNKITLFKSPEEIKEIYQVIIKDYEIKIKKLEIETKELKEKIESLETEKKDLEYREKYFENLPIELRKELLNLKLEEENNRNFAKILFCKWKES